MPVTDRARYDGQAEWYEERNAPNVPPHAAAIRDLLGPGSGWCLDLGCGTGHYDAAIRSTGRQVVGLDLSADQLGLARVRGARLIQGDATALPFGDATFDTVVAVWISTDVDEFDTALREAGRVLSPAGRLLVYGVHPCFNGPFVEYPSDETRIIHSTYRVAGRHEGSPWWRPDGIRRRVGMRHVPLADLVNAIVDAGLVVERMAEPGDGAIPHVLAIVAGKPRVESSGHAA